MIFLANLLGTMRRYNNPFKSGYDHYEQKALAMFWRRECKDRIQRVHELTKPERSKDDWLSYIHTEQGAGKESWENYCFTHGLPTCHVGSWFPGSVMPRCGNARCAEYDEGEWERWFYAGVSWKQCQSLECDVSDGTHKKMPCVDERSY